MCDLIFEKISSINNFFKIIAKLIFYYVQRKITSI